MPLNAQRGKASLNRMAAMHLLLQVAIAWNEWPVMLTGRRRTDTRITLSDNKCPGPSMIDAR
jgi:hypothetical protein